MVFSWMVLMALGFVFTDVPGATPKKPFSGLIALKLPCWSNFIQAMSSPTHSIFHPGRVGLIMARLVLPQALGNAAAKYFLRPSGSVMPRISMCSASHPSSLASRLAILRAKHFFPSSEFPPYPLPKEMISLRSGRWAMSVSSGLQAQLLTKGFFNGKGQPTECRHLTNSPSPSASRMGVPIRVMMRMLATT